MRRRDLILGAAAAAVAPAAGSFRASAKAGAGFRTVADRLAFPEGLFTLPDGSFGCVEIADANLVRFTADGMPTRRIPLGGGPNGAAIGPDGNIYIANNGGLSFRKTAGVYGITGVPNSYVSGSLQKVDRQTGQVTTLYTHGPIATLKGPNDLVFADAHGFWFTDTGKIRNEGQDKGGLYWAAIDGSELRQIAYPLDSPNGIALSPDRKTLYVALSNARQIAAYEIAGPGRIVPGSERIVCTIPGKLILDNIAVEMSGNLIVATVLTGGLATVSPKGAMLDFIELPDMAVTAVAFGGKNYRTLYAALSMTGRIVAIPWARPGVMPMFAAAFAA